MKYYIALSLASLFFILNACQSNEKPNQANAKPLFINYEVRYLEQENELRGLAYFKEGDSIEVATPREFTNASFQGSAMDMQNLGDRGIRYILTRKGDFSANLNFGYKNDNEQLIQYELSMPGLGNFSVKETQISKSAGATVLWTGEPLDDTQSLVFMFTDKNNKASSTSIKGPTTASEVFIPSQALANLAAGTGQLYLVKKQVRNSQEENQSIVSLVEYYTAPISVEIVE